MKDRVCRWCGKDLLKLATTKPTNRPRRYCSDTHRKYASRVRRQAAKLKEGIAANE